MNGERKYVFDINPNEVYGRMKDVRNELRLTQTEMGEKMGLSLRQYHRIENMIGLPVRRTFQRFCDLTNLNLDWLLYGREPKWTKDINKEKTCMTISDQKAVYNADINADLQVINKILSSDNVLRKRILNFLKMYRNLEKFDEGE